MNRSNSTQHGNELSSTDPRPRHIVLGTDAAGRHHHYISHTECIYVVDGSDVVHREDITDRHVDEWMAFVDQRVGWEYKKYGAFWAHVAEAASQHTEVC